MNLNVSNFSSQFIEILNAIGERVGVAIDWTSANVTPYLQDLINRAFKYIVIQKGIGFVLEILLVAICLIYFIKYFKFCSKILCEYEASGEECAKTVIWVIAGIIAVLFIFIIIAIDLPDFIKAIYFPEYFILQMIKEVC